ncbi:MULTISPECIES: hypothetical protein [Anaeromyxobacter]|uniref:hypothetical protein n=1 Tax=Anaeromyxobacter TaxID=161492 RepID=UPI001F58EA35|nr:MULTISPECIES: hypothetical protein [unclassified Anaeromyxobacter]
MSSFLLMDVSLAEALEPVPMSVAVLLDPVPVPMVEPLCDEPLCDEPLWDDVVPL